MLSSNLPSILSYDLPKSVIPGSLLFIYHLVGMVRRCRRRRSDVPTNRRRAAEDLKRVLEVWARGRTLMLKYPQSG